MKKITILFLLLLFTAGLKTNYAQAPDWTRVLQTNTFGLQSTDVVTADSGNVYMASSISGPITFEGSNFSSIGLRDMLISKLDNSGVAVWTKQFNALTDGSVTPNAIKTDALGNIFVSCSFIGTVTIGSNTVSSDISVNSFLAKIDNNGNGIWVTAFASGGNGGSKIALDVNGNSYLISRSSNLIKFDNTGVILWNQVYTTQTLQTLAVYGTDLYIGGTLQTPSTTFGSITLNNLGGYNTGFLLKADLDGVYNNSLVVGGSTTQDGSSVSHILMDNSGNLIITGAYTQDLILGAITVNNIATGGKNYTFVAKCDNAFTFSWVKSSTQYINANREMRNYRLFTDNLNNIYEYGAVGNPFQYDTIPVNPNTGQFLVKFDANGNAIAAYELQNSSPNKVYVTPAGKILSAGSYNYAGAPNYGNLFINQYAGDITPEWEKNGTGLIQSGTIQVKYVKHDATGNTYIQARVIGYCDYYGTIINTNNYVTVISKLDINGNLLWMHQVPDLQPDLYGSQFILDKDNNLLSAGLFKTSLTIDSVTLTTTNANYESYVAKYSSAGAFLWAANMNLGMDVSTEITLASDKNGNVLASGVTFPANYLVKFDPQGNQLWAKTFPMESYYTSLISTDSSNNIYLTSEIHLSDASGTATIGSVTLNQSYDDGATALIKFDPNGNALWAKTYGGVTGAAYSDGWPTDIKTDSDGNTFLWGWCVNNSVFGAYTLSNPIGTGYSLFITKINSAGNVVWANAVYEQASGFNYGDLLDLDNAGNVYIGGHLRDTISIDGNLFAPVGSNDFFVAKLSGTGAFQWIKTIPAGSNIINSLSVYDTDVLTIGGYSGITSTLGTFPIVKKGGSSVVVATLGNLTSNPVNLNAVIKKATIDPIIDGMIDTIWANANTYNIERNYTGESPTLGAAGTTIWKGLWTSNGIYILIQVNDDVYFPAYARTDSSADWLFDKPEIYFNVNDILKDGQGANPDGNGGGNGHYQFAPFFIEALIGGGTYSNLGSNGADFSFHVSNPVYVGEYFIPFTKLLDKNGIEVDKTRPIGFDITIADNDLSIPSRNRAVWSNTGTINESWNNMDDCGTITLEGATNEIFVTGLTVLSTGNATTISTDGGTLQFTASVLPADATNQMITWTVTKGTGFALISADGLLSALVNGTVTVTATTTDGTNLSASKVITISNQGIPSTLVYSLIGTAFYKADGITPGNWDYDIDLSYIGTSGNVSSYVLENQQILMNGEFKIRKDYQWSESWGPDEMQLVGDPSNFIKATGGPNFKAINEKVYNITFMVDWKNKSYRILMYDGSQYLITSAPDSILTSSAVIKAEVVYQGANPVTSRGVCWNTAPGPVVGNFTSENGSGIGTFTIKLTGLEKKTLYYVRAYAITSSDTIYGNEVSFRTVEFIDYTSSLNFFHPTAGGTYPANPYIANRIAVKTFKYIDSTKAETWFAIWDTVHCWIHINPDNSAWIEVAGNWPNPVFQGDPKDASKISRLDPLTGKIYLYYYYAGAGGNRIFWEEFTPPPPPTAPTNLFLVNSFIPFKVKSGTVVSSLTPIDINKDDTLSMQLVQDYGDNSAFEIQNELLVLASDLNLSGPKNFNISVRVSDNAGLSTEFQHTIFANSDEYEIQTVNFGETGSVNNLSVINNNVVWVRNSSGRIARTVDGGNTWDEITPLLLDPVNYGPVFAIDSLTAWVVVSSVDPGILKTIDGGSTWVKQNSAYNSSSFADVVYFWNTNEGFTLGDKDNLGYIEIYTTQNGGDNWVRVPQNKVAPEMAWSVNSHSILSVYKDTVWVSGNEGLIFRSTDKGYTWEAFQSPLVNNGTILFINGMDGIVSPIGNDDLNHYISHDGGVTWSSLSALNSGLNFHKFYEYFSSVPGTSLVAMTNQWEIRNQNSLAFSKDLGSSWTWLEFQLPWLQGISSKNQEIMWAGGFNNQVYKINLGNILPCNSEFTFTIDPLTGLAGFTSSSANATDYYWDFGDGSFSTEANPEHTYSKAGNYKVCLSIKNNITRCQSVSCKNIAYVPEGEINIIADFSFFADTLGLTVNFSDLSSSNTTNWYWTMGDGKIRKTQNPVYTYSKSGVYTVCLTAIDKDNLLLESVCKDIRVGEVVCSIGSDYNYFINPVELEVAFSSQATGTVTNSFWTFGDGSSSSLENPTHKYSSPGYYLVSLSVRNNISKCMDVSAKYIQVGSVDCRAGFTYGVNPVTETVNFNDDSKGQIEYYYWDFGDGGFSVLKNPDRIYKKAGIYLVGQTVIDNTNGCVDVSYQPVQVGDVDCSADFVSYIDSSTNTGYFTNRIAGEANALLWSFGDGRFSTEENPVHKFSDGGIYSVSLTIYDFNTGCMDSKEEMILIGSIGIDCEADFVYRVDPANPEVVFNNKSIGEIVGSVWNFGDQSDNSLETDAAHTYTKGGYYNVCLSVINSDGIRNTSCKWVLVQGSASNDCRANFIYTVDSTNLEVRFTDNSFGNIDKYTWDFGDTNADSMSILKDPEHAYDQKGYYLVQLKVENTLSGCISKEYKLLNVAESQVLKAAFGYESKLPDKKFAGYPVDLVSASSGDGATVEWDFGDKQIKKGAGNFTVMDSTSRIVTHYYANPGKYEVCLRISDPVTGKSDTYCSFVYTKNAVGVDEVNMAGLNLDVYPNPFVDYTTINYALPKSDFVEIAIFDELGRRIETLVKTRKEEGIYQLIWETKTITTGVYHLKMITAKGIITKQLVITK